MNEWMDKLIKENKTKQTSSFPFEGHLKPAYHSLVVTRDALREVK